jgi:hypothetical protein
MLNPEGFVALGGHALSVNRTARQLSQNDWRIGRAWQEDLEAVAALEPSTRERILGWTGDRLIAVGAWLRTQSGQAGYQHA